MQLEVQLCVGIYTDSTGAWGASLQHNKRPNVKTVIFHTLLTYRPFKSLGLHLKNFIFSL